MIQFPGSLIAFTQVAHFVIWFLALGCLLTATKLLFENNVTADAAGILFKIYTRE